MGKTSKRYIATKILRGESAPEIYNNPHGKRYKHKILDKFICIIYLETFEITIRNFENEKLNFPPHHKNV